MNAKSIDEKIAVFVVEQFMILHKSSICVALIFFLFRKKINVENNYRKLIKKKYDGLNNLS